MRTAPAIDGYGAGGFRIGETWIAGSLLVLDDVARPWRPTSLADLRIEDFAEVLVEGQATVEFVLLGAGPATAPPPKAVRQALQAAGLGLEVMDTVSAIRLYNVLAQDGRRIAAALLAV